MFRFKLAALLNHRRHLEDVCQKELALAKRQLADEQARLRQLKNDKRDHVRKLQAKQSARFNVTDIKLSVTYIQQLSDQIEAQKICMREAAKHVDRKRKDLIHIAKKRKTLEKFEAKQREAFNQKLMQNERKQMDEVASLRHVRKA